MEELYSAEELAKRWRCSKRTAWERMRQIGAFGRPMMCRAGAVAAWERIQEERNAPGIPKGGARKRKNVITIKQGPLKPGQLISRVRIKDA